MALCDMSSERELAGSALVFAVALCLAGSPAQAQEGSSNPGPQPPCFDNFNRYVDCGNGTVTDTVTGLVWLKSAQCLGVLDWASGSALVATLADGQCGLTDGSSPGHWRLPTQAEWLATIEHATAMGCSLEGSGSPPSLTNDAGTACQAVGPTSFAGVESDGYWSATSHPQHPNNAWVSSLVGTLHGFTFSSLKTTPHPIWPVRVGSR